MDEIVLDIVKLVAQSELIRSNLNNIFISIISVVIISIVISFLISFIFGLDMEEGFFFFIIILLITGVSYNIGKSCLEKREINKIEKNFTINKQEKKLMLDDVQIQEINVQTSTFMIDGKKVTPYYNDDTIYKKVDSSQEYSYVVLEYIDYNYKPFDGFILKEDIQKKLVRETNKHDYILLKELHYK